MSGPIVRSGPSPTFTKNWDSVFAKGKGTAKKSAAAATEKPAGKSAKKSAKPATKSVKSAKPAAAKPAKKAAKTAKAKKK